MIPFVKIDDVTAAAMMGLLSRAESTLKNRFFEVIDSIKNERTLAEIESLLVQGRFNEALASVELQAGRYASEVAGIYIASGKESAELLNDTGKIIFDFDQTNFRAVDQMRENRLRLIRGFTQGQIEATRTAIIDGIQRGINPRQQAINFRNSIGLTNHQQQSVQNYRKLLESNSVEALTRDLRDRRFDRTVRAAARNNQPLSTAQIDRMTVRYQERFIKFRAETIARTEALRSVHQGSQELFRQAIELGQIEADELIQTWITARSRVRDTHVDMNGQRRKFGEPFVSGGGVELKHPGDPDAPASEVINCRCVLTTRIGSL